jgi:trehalose 6-phosphate synthase/phosphatase
MSDGRLIIVSNRLPLAIRKVGDAWKAERTSGGLASAMAPVMRDRAGVWLGWPGHGPRVRDPARDALLEEWRHTQGFVPVDLPADVARRFYEGYANQTLWPLFHSFPARFEYDPEGWSAYVAANRRFRDAVLEEMRPDDVVWIHDYHLMLLPRLIRDVAPEARVGFFLHIPFPASETFRILPRRDDVLRGLLGADLVAFQTHQDLQHFRSSLQRLLGVPSRLDRVVVQGVSTRLEALPIGIAPDEFAGLLERDPDARRVLEDLQERYRGQSVLLGVDRLDYTKGIPHRLRAYRRLLAGAPDLRGKVVLVQVAVPTREKIPEYATLRQEVSELVGEINGEFGTPHWTPIVYMRRGITRAELVALYSVAAVGWVTPLRDGMNLVAKEYVACQKDAPGALVVSEFAGAAPEMGEAFLVNPYDEERVASTIERALKLSEEERRQRMARLYRRVVRNDVFAWGDRFLEVLGEAVRARTEAAEAVLQDLPVDDLLNALRQSKSRLVFLDYDGTLVPFADRPEEAVPPPSVPDILRRLAQAPGTTVVLISGRARHDLDRWFGAIPDLWLVAEHGACVRPPDSREWDLLRRGATSDWKSRVWPVLEHYVDRTPGSFIEEKEFALVWHYRMAEPEFGDWLANELAATLDEMLSQTELHAIRGQKNVEVRFAWANKASIVDRLEALRPDADFRLAIGDDRTDEDLFARLAGLAWTVRVGRGPSAARYALNGPPDVRGVLRRVLEVAEEVSQPAGTGRAR